MPVFRGGVFMLFVAFVKYDFWLISVVFFRQEKALDCAFSVQLRTSGV